MAIDITDDIKKTVLDYFGLKSYFSFRWAEIVNDSSIHNIDGRLLAKENGNAVFWNNVMKGRIKRDDKLRLIGFQVSPWFPRKPGLYWTKSAADARAYALKYHREKVDRDGVVLDVYGKNLMTELGGVGCINFMKNRNDVLITATSSGNTDEGIPLICTKRVWDHISNELEEGNRLALDIAGRVVNLPDEPTSVLLNTGGRLKLAVAVESILNITKLDGSVNVLVTPWTVFKTKRKTAPYGFTFATHDLYADDMNESVNWLKNYVNDHDGETIVTDFDEELNPLKAIFPLRNVASGTITNEKMLHFLQQIERDFRGEY